MGSSSEGAFSRGDPHKYVIAFAVVLASLLQVIDSSIVNVALPDMMGNLGASLDEIAWVSTGYILANVIVIPLTGWLGGMFGRKRYFVGSILLFTASSFFCTSAASSVRISAGPCILRVLSSRFGAIFPVRRSGAMAMKPSAAS